MAKANKKYTGFATVTLSDDWEAPALAWLDGKRINWPAGSYCYLIAGSKIHKTYPEIEPDDWHAAELQYVKDYPETPQPIEATGWLAPNGEFYGCSYAGHEGLADHLSLQIYGNSKGSKFLENNG